MGCISRGNLEGALRAYQGILRVEPRDKRVRQRVGELLLKLQRPREAETHFREVLEALQKEGNFRAAVAVAKQLLGARPEDAALNQEIGELYVSSGYPNDARVHFDNALRLFLNAQRPLDAARAAGRIADLAPGEPIFRLKLAELLEAGGDKAGAAAAYRVVADEYRRRGRIDEVGRIAEMLLKLNPDDVEPLLDAASARIDAGDPRKALVHLQVAYTRDPLDARTLDLLARAFEGAGQPDRAAKVLVKLAEVAAERQDLVVEADALRRAAHLLPDDADLQGRLTMAEGRRKRLERRITTLAFAQPVDETELTAVVRADVFVRYGFLDRAGATLEAAVAGRPGSPALLAALAELAVSLGRPADAAAQMQALLPGLTGDDAVGVSERIALLSGPAAEETAEQRGDRLAAKGDHDGAMTAYREALSGNPLNDEVLGKMGAVRTAMRAAMVLDDDGTYAEVSPDALEDDDDADDELYAEARSLVSIGMYRDALQLLDERTKLPAVVISALAHKGLGDVNRAVDLLRDATNEAAEGDPAYVEALYELASLYAHTGKQRSAIRLLEEVRELDATFRPDDVETRIRGLKKAGGG